jgi:hypothetical protein
MDGTHPREGYIIIPNPGREWVRSVANSFPGRAVQEWMEFDPEDRPLFPSKKKKF